ncbi:MAG: hypothetical protein ACOCV1_05515 [Bacillota bacterium]
MITLRKAYKQAQIITDENLPSLSALRNWSSLGCIQKPISYESKGRGGRVGLYDNTLPIQIAVVSKLKNEGFTLDEISNISSFLADKLSYNTQMKIDPQIYFKKIKKKLIKLIINQNDFSTQKIYKDGSIQMHLFEEEKFSQIVKMKKRINIAENYIDTWREKYLKLEELNSNLKKRKVE